MSNTNTDNKELSIRDRARILAKAIYTENPRSIDIFHDQLLEDLAAVIGYEEGKTFSSKTYRDLMVELMKLVATPKAAQFTENYFKLHAPQILHNLFTLFETFVTFDADRYIDWFRLNRHSGLMTEEELGELNRKYQSALLN